MRLRSMLALLGALAAACGSADAANDRTANLIGSWSCTTERGNTTKTTIVRDPDGSVRMSNLVSSAGGYVGTIRETYVPDASGAWKLTSVPDAVFTFGRYEATAGAWIGNEWIFYGSEPIADVDGSKTMTAVRLVYTDLFPAGFRREHQIRHSGVWHDMSEEVCKR